MSTIDNVKVGCKVMVDRPDEEPRKAEILSVRTRKLGRTQIRIAQEAAAAEGREFEIPPETTEYYVHYVDYNKRLDEWVTADRFLLDEGIEEPSAPAAGQQSAASEATPAASSSSTPKKEPPAPKKRQLFGAAAQSARLAAQRSSREEKPSKKSRRDSSLAGTPLDDTTESGGPATPSSAPEDTNDDEENIHVDATGAVQVVGEKKKTHFSKEGEIEKLRTSGSMTQSQTEVSRVKNLDRIQMGNHEVDAWYFSPYPIEYSHVPVLYICEYCLSFFASDKSMERHRHKCTLLHPPGNEIYRHDGISFFEIDGRKQKTWCRNLCLLSKAFLDHKTLYYDVDPFMFYLMCSYDEHGMHLLGYFSKEKESAENYNLACILTLPQYQRMGYGSLLIEFSYELSKAEGKVGSPEKPLSDLGLLSYRNYWAERIIDVILSSPDDVSIEDISQRTAIIPHDIMTTCQAFQLLKYHGGQYYLVVNDAMLEKYKRAKAKQRRRIEPSALRWKPPIFSRNDLRFGF